MNDLCWRQAEKADIADFSSFLPCHPFICELSVYLLVNRYTPENGRIWCGFNAQNRLSEVRFFTAGYVYLIGRNSCLAYREAANTSPFADFLPENQLCFMIYKGGFPVIEELENTGVVRLADHELKSFYAMLNNRKALPSNAEKAYVYRARCENRGLSETVGLYQNGCLTAGGAIVSKHGGYALIGDIYTREAFRNNGFASKILYRLIQNAKNENLTPVLICEKSMIPFYKKRGFEQYDQELYTVP